jgi:ABC-type Fe3+ transport system substrate-binding protein
MRHAWVTCGFVLALTLATAIGCGGRRKCDLVIVSPHDEKITQEFERGFGKVFRARTGREVRISWRDFGAGAERQVATLLDQFSLQPEGIGVDVFFGGGMDPYSMLKAKGLLAPYRIKNLEAVPRELFGVPLYDKDYCWYGTTLSSFGILYNKALLKKLNVPEPATWEDMTDPRLAGYVGLADPSQSGSAHAVYEIILQAYGWEKGMRVLTLMAANSLEFHAGSSSLVKDVAMGDLAMGPAIDYYGLTQVAQAGADKVGFMLPEKLTVITPDTIAILKGAAHLETAQMFLDFVMSEEGQKLWMLKAGSPGGPAKYNLMRMPVLPKTYDDCPPSESCITLNPFKFQGSGFHDAEKGTSRRGLVADLMKSLLIQPHNELVDCWKAVQKNPEREGLTVRMTELPVTEADALDLARTKWEDQVFRSQTMTEWVHFALKKYQQVRQEAESAGAQRGR